MRRSSADGRDTYYVLDLVRCDELLQSAGASLHPGLASTARKHRQVRAHVLFLCTGNSARSQIAEALCERLSGGAVSAVSAGSHPKPVDPNAVRVMDERGIDLNGARSKHLSEFSDRRFDYVISLCDRVREVCPEFPRRARGDPLEHPRTEDAVGVRAHRDRAFHPHRLSYRGNRGDRACLTNSSTFATWSTTSRRRSTRTPPLRLLRAAERALEVADSAENLRLLLSGPKSSAGRPMPDGRTPEPGGWNRLHFIVDDIASEVERLRDAGITFRNDIISGPGGQQILLEDPAGNPIELFQPAARDRRASVAELAAHALRRERLDVVLREMVGDRRVEPDIAREPDLTQREMTTGSGRSPTDSTTANAASWSVATCRPSACTGTRCRSA